MNAEKFIATHLGRAPKEVLSFVETDGIIIESSFSSSSISAYPNLFPECQNLPEQKNWAKDGLVTPVQNQKCGDCYLFAGVTAIEAQAAIDFKKPPVLMSRQNTLECVKKFPTPADGCTGGTAEWIFTYARDKKGLVAESQYPRKYVGKSSFACDENFIREADTEVDHWERIPAGDEKAMMCYIANYGPIVAAIAADHTSLITDARFRNHYEGIWSDPSGTCIGRDVDHEGKIENILNINLFN